MDGAHGLKWRVDVLPQSTQAAIELLAGSPWIGASGWYLAAGTALAVQTGYRVSLDLDFFSRESFEDLTPLRRLLPGQPDFVADRETPGALYGRLHGANISFICLIRLLRAAVAWLAASLTARACPRERPVSVCTYSSSSRRKEGNAARTASLSWAFGSGCMETRYAT
jgi:hypothetical protein